MNIFRIEQLEMGGGGGGGREREKMFIDKKKNTSTELNADRWTKSKIKLTLLAFLTSDYRQTDRRDACS